MLIANISWLMGKDDLSTRKISREILTPLPILIAALIICTLFLITLITLSNTIFIL